MAGVLLWVLIALLTGAAVMAVLVPLGREPRAEGAGREAQRVYRRHLEELEADRAQGLIGEAEAEAARVEIARRLLASEADLSSPASPPAGRTAARATAVAALVGIPLVSFAFYAGLGAPNLPGQPLAARSSAPEGPTDIDTLVAKVERQLAQSPDDAAGWDVIAPVYLRLGRVSEAERAFRNAIRLAGSSSARQTGLGEAILAAQGGVVTAEARAAFEAANQADPKAPAPRFFLALAAEQEGRIEQAAQGWQALLADTPADAPWRQSVIDALARVGAPATPGPDAAQVAAAQAMAPADRTAMIEGMVSGLAERLKTQPDDVEGWLRLIRSYSVLGRPDDAVNAARTALQGVRESAGRERVAALVSELGLPEAALTP